MQAPGVDAFLSFGAWRHSQETFLVIVLHLGPLPSHAELAANFSKALLHRVVQRLLMRAELSDKNDKKPVYTKETFAWKAGLLFILVQHSFKNIVVEIRERRPLQTKQSNLMRLQRIVYQALGRCLLCFAMDTLQLNAIPIGKTELRE